MSTIARSLVFWGLALGFMASGCGSRSGSPLGPADSEISPAKSLGPFQGVQGPPVPSTHASILSSGGRSGEVDFKGKVESISPPNLKVFGVTVMTDANTRIERDDRRILLTDLRVGDTVRVKGTLQAGGAVLAREIEVDEEDDEEVEFKGRVESVAPGRLVVSGVTIEIDAETRIVRNDRPIPLTDLRVGEFVEVEGILLLNGHVLAREIEVSDDVVVFRGKVKSTTPELVLVGVDVAIKIDVKVRVLRDCRPTSVTDIQVGEVVEVTGRLQADATVLVVKIKVGVNLDVRCADDDDDDDDSDDDDDDDDDHDDDDDDDDDDD